MSNDLAEVLTTVGPRLRALRQQRQVTLAGLSEETGVSVSASRSTSSSGPRPSATPVSIRSRSPATG